MSDKSGTELEGARLEAAREAIRKYNEIRPADTYMRRKKSLDEIISSQPKSL